MNETKLKIKIWPDEILRKKCKKIETLDESICRLLDDMCFIMKESKGIGLAANQVGVDLDLVVIETQEGVLKLVNPRIVKMEGTIHFLEGCLSFPGIELNVRRAKKVWLTALNEKGKNIDYEAEGALAVVFQHEVDHLNGIAFIDRVSLWSRLRIRPLLKKIRIDR